MDTVGKLPETSSGNKFILTVKDDFSKFVFAVPIKEQTSEEIANALVQHVFLIVGFAKIIVVDNATVFNSSLITELCKLLRVRKINTTIYHAQENSVERYHKDLGNFLRAFNDNELDLLLQWSCYNHNTSVNYSGFSPFELAFGRKPELPSDDNRIYTFDDYVSQMRIIMKKSQEIAKENEKLMLLQSKKYHDINAKDLNLKIDDEVFIKNVLTGEGQKLQDKFRGPFKVVEVLNDFNVVILDGKKRKMIHKNLLKLHKK